ncbi:DUF1648 domain-containing protein [Arabiibacter massiliensis]|uniref:DUF1648 domain-containing protein n=1 Tax=Arabiibacter massiliensis TaxID=1870985 RepID=UPI0009BA2240|nr:DUF1648 domain-containing protein [Arabiibacter massiliensis]
MDALKTDLNGEGAKPQPVRYGRIAVLAALAVLPLVVTAAAQPLLPDTVPVHFDVDGPDRWGSKAELFVGAGIIAVLELAVALLFAVLERQRAAGREDWIVSGSFNGRMSFPVVAGAFAVLDLFQAASVAMCFGEAGLAVPVDPGKLYVYALLGIVLLAMLAPALYMLVTGKGLSLVNFHPGSSELERKMGADTQQARAIGGLLLFLAAFVAVEFLLVVK